MSSITTIRTYVNDPTGVIYPDDYLYDSLNDSILDLFVDSKPETISSSLTMSTDDDIISIPPEIMIPQQILYNNLPYYITSQAELERWDRKWRTASLGQPKWFIRFDHRRIRLYPRPDQNYTMTMWGIGWPVEVNSTNTFIDSDNDWRQAIEHKTTSILIETARPDLANIHRQEYQTHRNHYLTGLRNSQGHLIRQIRPATRNNVAQLGSIQVGQHYK